MTFMTLMEIFIVTLHLNMISMETRPDIHIIMPMGQYIVTEFLNMMTLATW